MLESCLSSVWDGQEVDLTLWGITWSVLIIQIECLIQEIIAVFQANIWVGWFKDILGYAKDNNLSWTGGEVKHKVPEAWLAGIWNYNLEETPKGDIGTQDVYFQIF